jgi:hypothetical protein
MPSMLGKWSALCGRDKGRHGVQEQRGTGEQRRRRDVGEK